LEEFEAHAVPLGILFDLNSLGSQILKLQAGDMVLSVTDAFVERENPAAEQFGSKRCGPCLSKTLQFALLSWRNS
jgi:serine phosphatase RsbU (regulator of sigma subunit)